ncbi:Retrovirus-related Pol polyprotein from transposon [Apostichopus japonicus]|uniref:Retrovirus-related Pol polyprotein from transposon n=3 Tax=Stichopus japonicus TaxID=307972 RepID=A0A2G8JHI0_STIJA|nr:Retrovirus-related Pol polyprotein from transposon [Apostichopus japonicus]
MSKAERNYCVTRKELLAIVASVKHFHHYLYGAKFLIRTDHGALRWLTNFKNPEGQLARWLETLSIYHYEIQHRPGRLHGNADAMSRRPCTDCRFCTNSEAKEEVAKTETGNIFAITNAPATLSDSDATGSQSEVVNQNEVSPWYHKHTQAELREMQLNDNDIGPILLWKDVQESRPDWAQVSPGSPALKNYWGQWDRLKRKEGVLYRELESDSGNSVMLQLIVPKKLQQEILTQAHNHRLSGHLMAKKTLGRIRDKFYWSGYRRSVENWCRGCDQCASRKGPSKKFNAELKQYGSGHTMQRCAMDIMGPLPKSTRGNRYVLVIADYFTKWTEAYPMADMEAETVARLLVEQFICRYGVPDELHTDQGRQFESELFQHMCRLLDINKTRTTPFHPQSDGMVERFNRTLAEMLSAVVAKDQLDWDSWIPYVLMAYVRQNMKALGSPRLN